MQIRNSLTTIRGLLAAALIAAVAWTAQPAYAGKVCELVFKPKVVDAALKQKERPSTEELEKMRPENVWRHLENDVQIEKDPKFFKVLESAAAELLPELAERDVFLVARDGEWFFDSITAVIRRYPKAEKLLDRVHLLNLSRPVAQSTQPKNLIKYVEANDLPVEKVLQGKARVILIDTGERGTIFVELLQKIVKTHDFSKKDWKQRLENLLTGFEVRLLHSSMQENSSQILKKWKKMEEFDADQIVQDIEELGFGTMIEGKRKQIGIPTEHWQLHSWVVEAFERRKHWNGRATSVNGSGEVTKYENIDADRKAALYSQAQIIWHFSQDSVSAKFENTINQTLAKCGAPCKSNASNPPAPNVALPLKPSETLIKVESGATLNPGETAVTPSKAKYQVTKFLDEGKRGKVFQAKSLENDQLVALKLAVDKKADTLKSFAEEAEKNKGYKLAGIPHAKVIELGLDFMVKEFISGTRADNWLESWINNGMPSGTPQMKDLEKILKQAAKKGIYIGDLNPKNLIWTGSNWKLVDSGTWRDDLSEREILKRFDEKVVGRWTKKVDQSVAVKMRSELKLVKK